MTARRGGKRTASAFVAWAMTLHGYGLVAFTDRVVIVSTPEAYAAALEMRDGGGVPACHTCAHRSAVARQTA